MQNIRNVFHPRLSTACGVACEKTKLNSHCVAVPTAIPISRMRVGKISLMYSQGTGPHDMLYMPASRYTIAMEAIAGEEMDVALGSGGKTLLKMATMSISEPIMNAPQISDHFRPTRSTRKTTKMKQATTLITPKKPLIRRLSLPAPTALKI